LKKSQRKNQSSASSEIFTAYKIMQPLFEVIAYVTNTAEVLSSKLLYWYSTSTMQCCTFV